MCKLLTYSEMIVRCRYVHAMSKSNYEMFQWDDRGERWSRVSLRRLLLSNENCSLVHSNYVCFLVRASKMHYITYVYTWSAWSRGLIDANLRSRARPLIRCAVLLTRLLWVVSLNVRQNCPHWSLPLMDSRTVTVAALLCSKICSFGFQPNTLSGKLRAVYVCGYIGLISGHLSRPRLVIFL